MYVADENTITAVDYTNWQTISGPITHTVTVLTTEAVLVSYYRWLTIDMTGIYLIMCVLIFFTTSFVKVVATGWHAY